MGHAKYMTKQFDFGTDLDYDPDQEIYNKNK